MYKFIYYHQQRISIDLIYHCELSIIFKGLFLILIMCLCL